MISLNEPAASYHAWPAFSAGLAWDIVGPDGCLALAYHNSRWLNPDYVEEPDETLDSGVLVHLAALEEEKLADRVVIIDADSYRTTKAREQRDMARLAGKIPIINEREPGSTGASFQKVLAMRRALEGNAIAAELLWGQGNSEVSYDWVDEADGVHCKARADRVATREKLTVLVDLKTAASVSPDGFQRSTMRFGHHLRAAFYLDGWEKQDAQDVAKYMFVCVRSDAPFLVSTYQLSPPAIEWGRKLYRHALAEFATAHAGGAGWPSYTGDAIVTLDLPTWAEYQLADREAAGEL